MRPSTALAGFAALVGLAAAILGAASWVQERREERYLLEENYR